VITRKWGAAVVLGLAVGALALVAPANADHNPAVGGQFCGNSHEGDVHQSEDGDWYVCEEQGDDTQPRWYPTSEPEPEPTVTAEPTEDPTEAPTEDPTTAPPADDEDPADGDAAGLPETGASTGLIVGGAVALLALGGGLFLVARKRRLRFTA
jgi:LPXTG-motif cell wall-anchored protein